MTTKVVDSTVSQLLQDNSSVEYVEPQDDPIATIPNETQNCVSSNPLFDLHAEHNGEHCIASLDPKDTRENRFWFTVAMLVAIYKESSQTIRNNIESLYQDGELGLSKIFERRINIEDSCGVPHPTTIYNLTVLNRLGMCCFRKNKEAKKVRDKFNDVLVKHETQAQPTIYDYARALIAEKERNDALEAQNKALTAERDEAIRTKTQYQSNLAAQMSGRVGGLTTALNRVKLENDRLKGDRLTKDDVYIIMNTQGVSFTLKTVKDVIRDELNTISEYLDEPFPKITTGERTDPNGKTFEVKSFVYTRKTVQAFFEFVENNPMGWQARNRKFILGEWLNHHMTIPA